MVVRRFWQEAVEEAWRRRSVVWLVGVRRIGKTVLCRSLPDTEYFDCELPRSRRLMEDPEAFLEGHRGRRIVLDEVHRLANPSEVLKIAADHYPDVRVLATGSSTLGASARFRDTLAGRKAQLWLTPVLLGELDDFGPIGLERRMLRGGLPELLLAPEAPEAAFQDWVDSYWAKDVQELFRLERRHAFQRLLELALARSGGIFEATYFARACEVSRPTVSNYLGVLESTYVLHVLRPYSTHRPTEIVAAPKVYGFDTGFVCCHRGWDRLRREDLGLLWEHLVLNELHGHLQTRAIRYWRDKAGHEVDLVVSTAGKPPVAVECKWSAGEFDPSALRAFRRIYPDGENFVVAQDVARPGARRYAGLTVRLVSLPALIRALAPRATHGGQSLSAGG